MEDKINLYVYIGRMSPAHVGHQRIIHEALKRVPESNFLLVLGSSNAPTSYRNMFTLGDRTKFVRALFPHINIVSLADQTDGTPESCNEEWLLSLNQLIESWRYGREDASSRNIIFCAGSYEDVSWFLECGYQIEVFNRYDGSGPGMNISASGIRDALVSGRTISGMVDDRIVSMVENTFNTRWAKFKNR